MEVNSIIVNLDEIVEKDSDKVVSSPRIPAPFTKSRGRVQGSKEDKLSNILQINRDNVLRGIIFSEILGSPLARRRR